MALLHELAELESGVIFVLLWDEVVVDFAYQNLVLVVSFLASRVGKRVVKIHEIFSSVDEQTVLLGRRVGDAKEAESSFDVLLVALPANCSVVRVRLLDEGFDIEISVDGDAGVWRSGAACGVGRGFVGGHPSKVYLVANVVLYREHKRDSLQLVFIPSMIKCN